MLYNWKNLRSNYFRLKWYALMIFYDTRHYKQSCLKDKNNLNYLINEKYRITLDYSFIFPILY